MNCSYNNLTCEGLPAISFVCDMSSDHIAAEAQIERIIPMVHGIYQVAKALTNNIRNNTALLEGSYRL